MAKDRSQLLKLYEEAEVNKQVSSEAAPDKRYQDLERIGEGAGN